MRFEFDESRYTTKRGSIGEFSAEERDEIAVLRRNHPELHAWGDLAIEQAWRAYSDAVLMMGWSSDLSRSEDFLSFVCWEQTRRVRWSALGRGQHESIGKQHAHARTPTAISSRSASAGL